MNYKKVACFISFSYEKYNWEQFNKINNLIYGSNYYINYTERENKRNFTKETIWNYLHDRISGSSCTILLLSRDLLWENKHKIEYRNNDFLNSGWVYNEISASLRDWKNNRINGIVCVVSDELVQFNADGNRSIDINMLPEILRVNQNYIVFVSFTDFMTNHLEFIHKSIERRNRQIQSNGNFYKIKYDLHNKNK